MLKDVISSLMHDKVRTFFCWITFTLTSMFIFLFFTVAMSDAVGVTMYQAKSDIPTILMVASVALCSVEIVFANDFFIKNKSKDLAIRLVCGATYTQNAGYLLLQTIIILAFALPIGIVGGLALLPVVNQILVSVLHSDITISLNSQSILWAILVLGYVIFWTLLLNLSFSYRNSAAQLLNPNAMKKVHSRTLNIGGKVGKGMMKVVHLALFILPILMFYYQTSLVLPCTIFSLFGLIYVLNDFLFPLIDKWIHQSISNAESIVSLGFVRNDLNVLKFNILLFIVSCTLLVSLLTSTSNVIYQVLVIITYTAMNILLALSIMFKYANEMNDRPIKFKTLSHIGYLEEAKQRIVRKEVFLLYLFILICIMIYLVNIFMTLYLSGVLTLKYMLILFVGSLIPVIVCGFISWIYYKKAVLK